MQLIISPALTRVTCRNRHFVWHLSISGSNTLLSKLLQATNVFLKHSSGNYLESCSSKCQACMHITALIWPNIIVVLCATCIIHPNIIHFYWIQLMMQSIGSITKSFIGYSHFKSLSRSLGVSAIFNSILIFMYTFSFYISLFTDRPLQGHRYKYLNPFY